MRKSRKLLTVLMAVVILTLGAIGLVACGGGGAKTSNVYIHSSTGALDLPDYGMEQPCQDNYTLITYDDNTYQMTLVKSMDMYGTPGSVTIVTTGTYTASTNEDGDTLIKLSNADSIIYTTCGMFVMQYSWNSDLPDTAFPVEFLGSMGAHNTLEELQEFGKGFTVKIAKNEKEGQNDCFFEIVEE